MKMVNEKKGLLIVINFGCTCHIYIKIFNLANKKLYETSKLLSFTLESDNI